MPFQHILSFFAVGATAFLATLSFFNANYGLVFPYIVACGSWIIVISYEYNERVFTRAIQSIIDRQSSNQDKDQ